MIVEEVGTPNSPNVSGFAFAGGSSAAQSSALGASMATLSMANRPRSQSPAQMMQSSALASAQQAGVASDGSGTTGTGTGTGTRSALSSQHQYNLRSRPASFYAPATPLAPMSSSSAAAAASNARDVADGVGTSGIAPPSRSLTNPRHSPELGVGFSKPRCSLDHIAYCTRVHYVPSASGALHASCLM